MKKSIAVLGLGKYGKSLAENLYRMGADVLAVDNDEEIVKDFADRCTAAVCADLSSEDEVNALGLKSMDIVVTAMGRNLAASIMSIAVAKELGVPLVIAKSTSERMSSILLKVGADRILNPEGAGGKRSARILLSSSLVDFFEVDENMDLAEMMPKKEWIGKTLIDLNLRKKQNMNVVAIKDAGGHWDFADPKKPLTEESTMLIALFRNSAEHLI
jgi:trk system potassium uptake protein TrkA